MWLSTEIQEIETNLNKHKVDIYKGVGSFEGGHVLKVTGEALCNSLKGTILSLRPDPTPSILQKFPSTANGFWIPIPSCDRAIFLRPFAYLGAGYRGGVCDPFATLGTKVYLDNKTDQILSLVDKEIIQALIKSMETAGVEIISIISLMALKCPLQAKRR